MVQWLERQTWDPTVNETMEGGRQGLVIDVVYTWVNGSDPKLVAIKEYYQDNSPFFKAYRETMAKFARMEGGTGGRVGGGSLRAGSRTAKTSSEGKGDLTANRFRDMDELRYSVRSVAQYADGMFDKIHILTTVVDKENEEGQVPSWLDLEASKQVVQLVNHDMIFENKDNLPSFNSLAIESQIHHIPGMTDIFMYLNDDVFLGRTTSFADVWTPLYGFVFHLEPTLLVPPTILPAPEYTLAVGEWNSLQYSNYLLSKQFGARHRSYLAHVPHVLSTTLLQEIQSMWSEELSETSSHRFRGEGEGHDVQVSFFLAHYVMERLRETQLTSFWFHRLDADQDGQLDWSERERLLKRIDDWNQIENRHRAFYPPLPYFDNFTSYLDGYQDRLQQLGYGATGSSIYRQSGLDGYPFILKNANTTRSHWVAEDVRPYLVYDEVQLKTCHFDVDFCLGSEFKNSAVPSIDLNRSSEIFERMAFSEFHCGDCLLHMLRQSSTEPGLASEILPVNTTSESYARVVQDLKKYNYVVASSSYSFVQLGDPISSRSNLNQILTNPDTESFFCINDNAGDNPQVVQMIQQVFKDFLETRFAFPSPWEKKS
ncbi:Xanthine phosphoribosyltransferase 1 [Mortierella claussenii]|nr:Xanthine phosphoribosyltransferase 1 [Mortierella claussenii]